jgi:hypothetical protein
MAVRWFHHFIYEGYFLWTHIYTFAFHRFSARIEYIKDGSPYIGTFVAFLGPDDAKQKCSILTEPDNKPGELPLIAFFLIYTTNTQPRYVLYLKQTYHTNIY